ncbi:MAG: hypothetical protein A3G34_16445 [Candidatus Lindowbacteria bacterium RIFCSPLOWO2_12_FULL_62_27]|nr:MAG: hypothetical protein A3G34_16445 [Candidatus Lindowbacteria bacterium RIFCSPLOWO2_12_FULL_62_27]
MGYVWRLSFRLRLCLQSLLAGLVWVVLCPVAAHAAITQFGWTGLYDNWGTDSLWVDQGNGDYFNIVHVPRDLPDTEYFKFRVNFGAGLQWRGNGGSINKNQSSSEGNPDFDVPTDNPPNDNILIQLTDSGYYYLYSDDDGADGVVRVGAGQVRTDGNKWNASSVEMWKEWPAKSVLGMDDRNGEAADTLHVYWDTTFLYIGYDGFAAGSQDLFVAIDVGSTSGETEFSDDWDGGYHFLPFKADYLLTVEGGDYKSVRNAVDTQWNNPGDSSIKGGTIGAAAGTTFSEFRIRWSNLGGFPRTLGILAYQKWDATRNISHSFPTQNPATYTEVGDTLAYYYYWENPGPDTNPRNDSQVRRGTVKINEVLWNSAVAAEQYVELYNPRAYVLDISNYTLKDPVTNNSYSFPSNTLLQPGKFVVFHPATGTNYTDSFGVRHFYSATAWDIGGAGGSDDSGALELYRGSQLGSDTLIDFVTWSNNGSIGSTLWDDTAVTAGIWRAGVAIDVQTTSGNTDSPLIRKTDGLDSDGAASAEWQQIELTFLPGITNAARGGPTSITSVAFKDSDFSTDRNVFLAGDTVYVLVTATNINTSNTEAVVVEIDGSGNLDLVAYENGTNSSSFRGILRTLLGSSTTYASAEDSARLPSVGGITARTKIDTTKSDSVMIDTYPYLTRSTYSHKNKELFLYFSRPIDTSTVDVSRCTVQANADGSGNLQNLSGASVKNAGDSNGVTLVLTTAQRNTIALWEDSTLFVAADSGAAFGTSSLPAGLLAAPAARALDSYVTGYDTAVKINEVYPQAGSYADSAFIELFFLNNTEFGWIDLRNWYVAERADTRDFFISPSINMGPGDFVTIYRDTAPNNINLSAGVADSGIYYSGSNFFVQTNFNQVALYNNRTTQDSRTIVDYFAWHRSDTAGETMPEMIHAIDTGIWTAYDSFSYTAASDVSGSQKSMMLTDNGVDSNSTTNWTENNYTPGRTNRVNDAPTVAATDIIQTLGSPAFVPGDTYRIRVKYTDANGGASIQRFDLRITNGADTIWVYSVRGDTAIGVSGDTYLSDSVTLDTSISGNDVTCTWKLAFGWNFANATNYLIGARATDTYVDTGTWTDSTISWTYSNVLTLSGTLTGAGVTNGAVDTDRWFQAGQSVTWAGLTVYMKNTTVSPKTYFCTFTVADDSDATDTQTDSFVLNLNKFVSTVTDTSETVVVKLVNVPSPGTFDTTTIRYSQTFRVDDTVPTMIVRDDTYVFKADTFTRAPAIKIDFYNGDSVSLLDTAQVQVGGAWYDVFTTDADSRVGDWFLSGPAFAALDTVNVNAVAVRLYDQAGWSVTRYIHIYYEPITINGSVSDWQGDEKMQVDSNENIWFMLAWDDTCLYLAYQPKDINTSNSGDFFVYMDIMPESGINTSIDWGGGGIHNLPTDTGAKWDASFCIEDSASTPGIEFQQVLNNSSWRLMLNRNDIDTSAGWGRVIGTAGVPYTEVRIPWMYLTNNKKRPDTFNIVAFQQYESESNIWTSYPAANPGGGSEADLTYFYQFLDASDTFVPNSLFKTLVNIDAGLADWPDTTILPAYGVRDYRLWWDPTFLFAAVSRGSAFPTTAANDVIQIYIDTGHVTNFGAETTVSWSGVHNLPSGMRPDYVFLYAPNNGGGADYTDLRKWRASDSAWVGGQTWNGAVSKNNGGGLAEISIPWKDLGDTPEAPITQAKFLLYTNQGDNGNVQASAPNSNAVDSAPVSFTSYIYYDSLTPAPTTPNAAGYLRSSAAFRDAGETKVKAFTPFIDGAKDPGWGSTADTTGLGAQRPNGVVPDVGEDDFTFDDTGLARGLYITNDISNLYLGWEAMGRHYDKENGVSEPGHYEFIFFTDTNPAGTSGDPWKTGVSPATRVYKYSADFWANAWMGYQAQDYGGMTLYKSRDTDWTSTGMTGGTDFKVSESNRWGELKVSLTTLGLKAGDTVGIVHIARHASPKPGISDITPFQGNAVSTWSDTFARIDATLAKRYVIQSTSNSNVYHRPADQPVAGKETMRSPVTPVKSQSITITAGASPIGNFNNLFVVYSKDTWATSDSVAMASAYTNGADEFFEGVIPASFAKGDSVRYYIQISEAQNNYVYGDNASSTVTLSKTAAQDSAFVFSVINAVPTALDSVTLTPLTPLNSSSLNASCTGSVDADGDTIFYQFEWYQNHSAVAGLVFVDSVPPYTDTLSADSTAQGDVWYCRVSVGDGRETSAVTQSNAVNLGAFTDWTGTAPAEINTARVTDSEWIWLDKSNEERAVVTHSDHFDFKECRLKMDTENLYFRVSLRKLTVANYPNIAIAIDTDGASGSGNATIGDESQTSFGDSYVAPALAAEVQLVVHTHVSDSAILEIQTAAGWTDTTAGIEMDTAAYVIEGKVSRSAIGLVGSDTIQIAIASFKNRVGKASAINSTVEFGAYDALDAVSIPARDGTASFTNDAARSISADQEDLSDGDIDFWVQLRYTSAGLLANLKPNTCTGPFPRSGDTTDVLAPTLRWTRTTDSDADDTVTSYLVELGTDTNLDGVIRYRVNVSGNDTSYTIPADMPTNTIYYWRVRARDRTGTLSDTVLWNFRTTKPTITVNRPQDINNKNNMNRYQDKESADSAIYWQWAPATHSNTWVIQNYAIEISHDSNFVEVVLVDTLIGTAAAGCTTNYTIRSDSGAVLVRGRTYYARIRAGDTAATQNWSPNSPPSDGIYYSMRNVNGDSSDWAPNLGLSNSRETYILTKYEAAWRDSQSDHRNDNASKEPYLDLDQVRFAMDPYNLYLFMKFFRWEDGTPYIQVALDIGSLSSERAFLGRNIYAEDGFVNSSVPWEYLISARTGNDDVTIYNENFTIVGEGRYTENAQDSFVEICVPLSLIGGAAEYTSDTVRITPTVFWNDNGGIGQFGANNANFVDVVTHRLSTWNDVQDQSVDAWLAVGVDSSTRLSGVKLDTAAFGAAPLNPSRTTHFGKMRDIQIYNLWISRWWDGRKDNQRTGASSTSKYDINGDLQGLIDYIKDGYFNWFGITHINFSPALDFGSNTGWGYDPKNQYAVDWSYANPTTWGTYKGFDEYVRTIKEAKRHNLGCGQDWITPHSGGSSTFLVTQNSGNYLKADGTTFPMFGDAILPGVAESRQYFSDHARFLYALGMDFLRVDNAKFTADASPPERGLPFYAYWGNKLKDYAPDLYSFGEAPSGADVQSAYCGDGNRLIGMIHMGGFDERLKGWATAEWTGSGNTSDDLKSRWESDYGTLNANGTPVMTIYYENHDHDRAYHYTGEGHTWSKSIGALLMIMYWEGSMPGVPYIFYGDELVMMGKRGLTYPDWQSTGELSAFGTTRRFPWNHEGSVVGQIVHDGSVGDIQASAASAQRARQIFPAFRYDQKDQYWSYSENGKAMAFIRGRTTTEEVLVLMNASQSGARTFGSGGIAIGALQANKTYKDWFSGGTATTDGSGNLSSAFSVGNSTAAYLKVNSFGKTRAQITVQINGVNQNDAVVSIDDKAVWTRESKNSGTTDWIVDIVTSSGGTTQRRMNIWKAPYEYRALWNFTDGVDVVSTIDLATDPAGYVDNTPPQPPSGLMAVARDRAVELEWPDNPSSDTVESYYIYRSKTQNDASPPLYIEVIRSTFFDNDFDYKLVNGDTYYYKIKALDRNGNLSGFSNEAMATPGTVKVTFQTDVTSAPGGINTSSITKMYVAGNPAVLGKFDFNNNSAIRYDAGFLPVQMTLKGRGIYEAAVNLDPTLSCNYIFIAEINSGGCNPTSLAGAQNDGDCFVDYNAAGPGAHWNSYTYEPCRQFLVPNTPDHTFAVVNRFNVVGDQAPQAPQGLSAVPRDGAIRLGWSFNLEADISHYEIHRSTDGVTFTSLTGVGKDVISYTDGGLTNGTLYYYKMKAVDINKNFSSLPTDSVSARPTTNTDDTAPAKPAGVIGENGGLNSVVVKWDYSTEADLAGYNVYRSATPNFNLTSDKKLNASLISPSFSPFWNDSTAQTNTQYYYAVSAVDDFQNESDSSTVLSAKLARLTFTVDVGTITTFGNVKILSNDAYITWSGKAMLDSGLYTWTYTTDMLTGFNLQYRYFAADTQEKDFTTSSRNREVTVPSVASKTFFDDWQEDPDVVSNLKSEPDSGAAWLFWDANTKDQDLIGYNVYQLQTSGAFTKVNSAILANTNYHVTGLTNGTSYSFAVRSVDTGALVLESPNSNVVNVTPGGYVYVDFRN